jgi:hypothetical protein
LGERGRPRRVLIGAGLVRLGFVDPLPVAFEEQRRAVRDLLAGTVVVDIRTPVA